MKWYKHQVWKYRETTGIGKDDKLNSDKPVTQLFKKGADKLNVICRLKSFLSTYQRKILVHRFIYDH